MYKPIEYLNSEGKRHRDDGPAVKCSGYSMWLVHGKSIV